MATSTWVGLLTVLASLGVAVFTWWASPTRRRKDQVLDISRIEDEHEKKRIHVRDLLDKDKSAYTQERLKGFIRNDK